MTNKPDSCSQKVPYLVGERKLEKGEGTEIRYEMNYMQIRMRQESVVCDKNLFVCLKM